MKNLIFVFFFLISETTTTTHNWNYTLPNLFDYFESLLSSQPTKNKTDIDIINNLNSSFFIFGNFSETSSLLDFLARSSSTSQPINKPVFSLNFTFKSTVSSIMKGLPSKLNASDFRLLHNYHHSNDFYGSGQSSDMGAPPSTNLMLDTNESFVSIDNTWWLPGNESFNLTEGFSNRTDHEALKELITMIVTSTVLGIMILTTIIGKLP